MARKGPEAVVVQRDTSELHAKFSAHAVADEAAHRAKFPKPVPVPHVPPGPPRVPVPPVPASVPAKAYVRPSAKPKVEKKK